MADKEIKLSQVCPVSHKFGDGEDGYQQALVCKNALEKVAKEPYHVERTSEGLDFATRWVNIVRPGYQEGCSEQGGDYTGGFLPLIGDNEKKARECADSLNLLTNGIYQVERTPGLGIKVVKK